MRRALTKKDSKSLMNNCILVHVKIFELNFDALELFSFKTLRCQMLSECKCFDLLVKVTLEFIKKSYYLTRFCRTG